MISLINDVALLFLADPIQYAENVGTLCVAQPYDMVEFSGCLVTGWGKKNIGIIMS